MTTPYLFSNSHVDCPMCKTGITFRSISANIKVCPTCNSAVERLEVTGLTNTLSIPVLKKDAPSGILKIGTTGRYKDISFEIIGAIHCVSNDHSTKRWTVIWSDSSTGLLVETNGFYAIHEKINPDLPGRLLGVRPALLGTQQVEVLKGKKMIVFDKANYDKCYLEGEVLSMDRDGTFTSVELGELNGDRLELIELYKGSFELYKINYVELYELSLSGLQVSPPSTSLPCGNCGKPVLIRLPHESTDCVCSHCHGWNEINEGRELKFNQKNFQAYIFALPVGTKGNINGAEYEVTGATVKNEAGAPDVLWREYTLYDAAGGYAFLAEYNGHWSFLKEVKLNCAWPDHKTEILFNDENFILFNDYGFAVRSAAGEFFTSLNTGDISAREYISPPQMYAVEKDGNKSITWFKAHYITNTAVFEGFGLIDKNMPPQYGVGPLQAMKFHIKPGLLTKIFGIIALVFLAVQVFFEFSARQYILYENTFYVPDSVMSRGLSTASFQLTPARSNLEFLMSSPVDNSWIELAVTLVNDKTGTEYSFQKGVEYYHGYSEGESWTEGATNSDVILSSIPAGSYHLNIFPSAPGGSGENRFSVSVVNDVPMWSNFFIVLGLLSLYPLFNWLRTQNFEKKRWNSSANNPYQKDNHED